MEGDVITLNDIFQYEVMGEGPDGRLVQAAYGVKPEDTTPEALAALTA